MVLGGAAVLALAFAVVDNGALHVLLAYSLGGLRSPAGTFSARGGQSGTAAGVGGSFSSRANPQAARSWRVKPQWIGNVRCVYARGAGGDESRTHLTACPHFSVVATGIEGTVESSKVLIASFQELVTELGPLGYLLYMGVFQIAALMTEILRLLRVLLPRRHTSSPCPPRSEPPQSV